MDLRRHNAPQIQRGRSTTLTGVNCSIRNSTPLQMRRQPFRKKKLDV
jgi:hypothetical protein